MSPIDGNLVSDDFVRRTSRAVRQVERWRGRNPRRLEAGRFGTGAAVRRLRLKTVHDDYLTCRTWDGETEGDDDILVAKPFFLQKTPWNGKTRNGFSYGTYAANSTTRISTRVSDSNTENQVVLPDWIVAGSGWDGDEIIASSRKTGIIVSGNEIMYEDTNRDARAWHKAP